jgi:chromosome partitioning protein
MNNALVISNYYLVPVAAEDKFGLKGLTDIFKMAEDIKSTTLNRNLNLLGILITLYDSRTSNSKRMEEVIRKQLPDRLLNTIINRNTDISQAITKDKTVFQHDRRAQGAKDYLELAKEVIDRVEERRIDRGARINAEPVEAGAV